MGKKIKPQKHNVPSEITQYLKKSSLSVSNLEDDFFLLSFRHLDRTQGDDFYSWENQQKLAHAIEVLSGYCKSPLESQFSDKFTCYGSYPSAEKAGYKCPSYIPEDAKWARIHITGTQIVAGHIVRNVFYIVFLDPDHKFYMTNLQDR
jgi:hypothetical protein